MRRNIIYLLTIVTAMTMLSCISRTKSNNNITNSGIGEPYELFVICNDNSWERGVKDAVAEVLECEVPGLSRPEKYFHVVDQASFDEVSDLERTHTNLLAVHIDPTETEASMIITPNVYASPQVLAKIYAPTTEAAAEFIRNEAVAVREAFEASERTLHLQILNATSSDEPMRLLKEATGIDMHIPGGFNVAKPKDKDLQWFVRYYPTKIQHIFAYTEPCDDINTLSANSLEASLDKHLGVVPSAAEGSYMCISKYRDVYIMAKEINGRTWYELRGCWRVEGDQMGGPLVSYTTYDQAKRELITIVFALYSPEIYQRNDMAFMESMIFLTK